MPKGLSPFYMRLRFATSMIATWLLNLRGFGFSLKNVCSPGFNCHGCPWATGACPVGVMAFGSAMHALPVLAIASVLAVGAVLGRLVCSFVCPFGLLQDLLYRIPSPKISLPRFVRYGKYLCLVLLVFVLPYLLGFEQTGGYLSLAKPTINKADAGQIKVDVIVTNLGTEPVASPELLVTYRDLQSKKEVHRERKVFPGLTVPPGETEILPTFTVPNHLATAELLVDSPQSTISQTPRYQLYFCRLCPNGTLTATLPSYFTGNGTTPVYSRLSGHALRLGILAVFLVLMVIASRPFCRMACPLGAIYALTTPVSLSSMTIDHTACVDCGLCNRVCPMELKVSHEVGGPECIACGDCVKVCPRRGIKRSFGLGQKNPASNPQAGL
ncbi:MAG: 4Fe-4S binding protein [Bacillota bacterium]